MDFVFTDPPYGHNNNNGDLHSSRWEAALGRPATVAGKARPIANDGGEANDLVRWFYSGGQSPACRRRLTAAAGCCGGGGGPDPQFARWSLWMDGPLALSRWCAGTRDRCGMGWHYRRSYETVLVGEKRGGACRWYDTTGAVENVIRPGKIRKIIPQADDHPTPKDPNLALHFIRLHQSTGRGGIGPVHGSRLDSGGGTERSATVCRDRDRGALVRCCGCSGATVDCAECLFE